MSWQCHIACCPGGTAPKLSSDQLRISAQCFHGIYFCSYTDLAFNHVIGTLICKVCNVAKEMEPRFKGMDDLAVHAHHFLRRALEATSPSLSRQPPWLVLHCNSIRN